MKWDNIVSYKMTKLSWMKDHLVNVLLLYELYVLDIIVVVIQKSHL